MIMQEKLLKQSLRALPAYFGGKRKIIQHIFSDGIPNSGIVVDPMAGSMTVPLAAKLQNYGVIANDNSVGSYIIGKALIENNTNTIHPDVVRFLIEDNNNSNNYISERFGDVQLPMKLAQYADNIHDNISTLDDSEQWPYKLLLYRFLTFMAPFNLYRYPGLTKGFLNNSYPDSMQLHINKWNKNIQDPIPTLAKMTKQINSAIVPGNGTIKQMDVFDFMDTTSGDILYFDPPYAGAGVPYEKGYEVIEQMMAHNDTTRCVSVFNDINLERESLSRVLSHTHKYKCTVFSYWTELHDREWFSDLFNELNLTFVEVPLGDFQYSYSTKIGKKGTWTSDKSKGIKEILFILTA